MKIIECYVESFGTLKEKKYVFSEGLNAILDDNGKGKSTLTAFICAMFYGLSDTKKTSLDENDRKKYLPWSGGVFGGSLTFEASGKKYRIERTFGKRASEDTATLYDAASGRVSTDFGECVGEELFGIDVDGFLRTVFLSEKSISEKNENKSIGAKLSGVTGISADLGELDEALEILENRRRHYYKKGGSGVISDKRAEITALEEEISRLMKKEEELDAASHAITDMAKRLDAAKAERDALDKKRLQLGEARQRELNKSRYNSMRGALVSLEEEFAKYEKFFKNGIPTYEEIDKNRAGYLDFERAKRDSDAVEDSELAELRAFFKNGTSFKECEEAYDAARRTEESPAPPPKPALFAGRVPEREELAGRADALLEIRRRKSRRPLALIPLVLSAALFIPSLILEFKSLFSLVALPSSLLLLTLAAIVFFSDRTNTRKKEAEAQVRDYIRSVAGTDLAGDSHEILAEMLRTLDKYSSALKESQSEEANAELKSTVLAFLAKFPAPKAPSLKEAVFEIKEKFRRYEALTISAERILKTTSARLDEAALARREAEAFLTSFPTVTDVPFEEIRDTLTRFISIRENIKSKRLELADFERTSGALLDEKDSEIIDEAALGERLLALENEISELSRRKIISERAYENDKREVEGLDLLIAKRDEARDDVLSYEKTLDVIQKTKKYLIEAHESMTKRYLGKTKTNFEKYIGDIAGAVGDFALDTDFTVTCFEGAAARKSASYSRGTRELFALAMRLALTDALFENESPFIILDDPFMSFDDKTLDGAKRAVRELAKSRQIIYLTCSSARAL